MGATAVDRRHHRRVDLPVSVSFREMSAPAETFWITGSARDVGLAGAYVLVPQAVSLASGTAVAYSVEVPPEQQRQFPFNRLLGSGWIVRVDPQPDGQAGVAIAFASNATALSAVQP